MKVWKILSRYLTKVHGIPRSFSRSKTFGFYEISYRIISFMTEIWCFTRILQILSWIGKNISWLSCLLVGYEVYQQPIHRDSIHIERANMHCQGIACTILFHVGLTSAVSQKLKRLKWTAINIFYKYYENLANHSPST